MRQKIEVSLIPTTVEAARVFVAAMDTQIAELSENLDLAKAARGAIARTFGIDRRDGATPMQQLIDGANRSLHEVDQAAQEAIEKELEIGNRERAHV